MVSTKRKSTKRKSYKRKSARRSTKRRSVRRSYKKRSYKKRSYKKRSYKKRSYKKRSYAKRSRSSVPKALLMNAKNVTGEVRLTLANCINKYHIDKVRALARQHNIPMDTKNVMCKRLADKMVEHKDVVKELMNGENYGLANLFDEPVRRYPVPPRIAPPPM